MRLKHISVLLVSLLVLVACSENYEPVHGGGEDEEHTYSFTAVLDGPKTRVGYQEDPDSHDLKMVWDEGDVIRLYPDKSMGDAEGKYYDFVANTGAGTSHTVFVHQGYITNWEHWSGKAIYVFPDGDNVGVADDSEEFLAKAYVQKSNDNTEHLKYGEFVPTADGKKSYTGYWAALLNDANLKHDHKHVFEHRHTLVYKIMLRGFLFDIPGGSQLRMSGDAWPNDEVTTLTLGDKDDTEPFLSVGEPYGKAGYKDPVLTAYIIRQVVSPTDGVFKDGGINSGDKLKFELLTFDELDGEIMDLDKNDDEPHRKTADDPSGDNYFTNIPWGDEYIWTVTATKDVEYLAGDYVVANLTGIEGGKVNENNFIRPLVAIDLGLTTKWAAFNVGAVKPDERGWYFVWSITEALKNYTSIPSHIKIENITRQPWVSGNTQYDAAAVHFGPGWRMPTKNEMYDFLQYTEWPESDESESPLASPGPDLWNVDHVNNSSDPWWIYNNTDDKMLNGIGAVMVRSKVNDRYVYMTLPGYLTSNNIGNRDNRGYYMGVDLTGWSYASFQIRRDEKKVFFSFLDTNRVQAFSVRAVRD